MTVAIRRYSQVGPTAIAVEIGCLRSCVVRPVYREYHPIIACYADCGLTRYM
jgi:hypothetical protein